VVKLPREAPLDTCALLGCAVMTGAGAVFNTAKVEAGSRVAVFGVGGVGLNVIQAAAIAGAASVVAVDARAEKLERARSFGATETVDASETDAVKAVRAHTEGRGADYAFEAVGRPQTIEQAVAATRKGGTCVVVGIAGAKETVTLSAFGIPFHGRRLLGCWYGNADVQADVPRLLGLVQEGRLRLGELVTRRYRLEDVNDAFADMTGGSPARGLIVF
jgi:S-(hydroxymethyl)glutathione dehydrogenase / alcohol dehydrogenase